MESARRTTALRQADQLTRADHQIGYTSTHQAECPGSAPRVLPAGLGGDRRLVSKRFGRVRSICRRWCSSIGLRRCDGAEKARPLSVSLDFSGTDAMFDCPPGFVSGGQVGTGHLSHLGRVEISGGQCSNFVTLEIADGFGTYGAANGDSIDIEHSGSAVLAPEGFDGWGTAVIVGGSGRFASASGAFDFTFTTFLFPDAPGETLLDGGIG